ncbi:hypothetical protein E4U51_007499 [Claviceps purpurea]|nr:hypothetical protein E4U51_007499 [Claviceps purpurea]
MRFAINNSSDPIWLNPNPKTFDDAASNLRAFSTEGRSEARFRDMPGAVEYSNRTAPRLRECYGWTSISGKELWALPLLLKPPELKINGREVRNMRSTEDYRAIVDGRGSYSSAAEFLLARWMVHVPMRIENRGGAGILLDMADAVCLCHMGWRKEYYLSANRGNGGDEITGIVT